MAPMMDFQSMRRRRLQSLCKQQGVPANLSNAQMAKRLASLLNLQAAPDGEKMKLKGCLKGSSGSEGGGRGRGVTKKVSFLLQEEERLEFKDPLRDSEAETLPETRRSSRRRRSTVASEAHKSEKGMVQVEQKGDTLEVPVRNRRSGPNSVAVVWSPVAEKIQKKREAQKGVEAGHEENELHPEELSTQNRKSNIEFGKKSSAQAPTVVKSLRNRVVILGGYSRPTGDPKPTRHDKNANKKEEAAEAPLQDVALFAEDCRNFEKRQPPRKRPANEVSREESDQLNTCSFLLCEEPPLRRSKRNLEKSRDSLLGSDKAKPSYVTKVKRHRSLGKGTTSISVSGDMEPVNGPEKKPEEQIGAAGPSRRSRRHTSGVKEADFNVSLPTLPSDGDAKDVCPSKVTQKRGKRSASNGNCAVSEPDRAVSFQSALSKAPFGEHADVGHPQKKLTHNYSIINKLEHETTIIACGEIRVDDKAARKDMPGNQEGKLRTRKRSRKNAAAKLRNKAAPQSLKGESQRVAQTEEPLSLSKRNLSDHMTAKQEHSISVIYSVISQIHGGNKLQRCRTPEPEILLPVCGKSLFDVTSREIRLQDMQGGQILEDSGEDSKAGSKVGAENETSDYNGKSKCKQTGSSKDAPKNELLILADEMLETIDRKLSARSCSRYKDSSRISGLKLPDDDNLGHEVHCPDFSIVAPEQIHYSLDMNDDALVKLASDREQSSQPLANLSFQVGKSTNCLAFCQSPSNALTSGSAIVAESAVLEIAGGNEMNMQNVRKLQESPALNGSVAHHCLFDQFESDFILAKVLQNGVECVGVDVCNSDKHSRNIEMACVVTETCPSKCIEVFKDADYEENGCACSEVSINKDDKMKFAPEYKSNIDRIEEILLLAETKKSEKQPDFQIVGLQVHVDCDESLVALGADSNCTFSNEYCSEASHECDEAIGTTDALFSCNIFEKLSASVVTETPPTLDYKAAVMPINNNDADKYIQHSIFKGDSSSDDISNHKRTVKNSAGSFGGAAVIALNVELASEEFGELKELNKTDIELNSSQTRGTVSGCNIADNSEKKFANYCISSSDYNGQDDTAGGHPLQNQREFTVEMENLSAYKYAIKEEEVADKPDETQREDHQLQLFTYPFCSAVSGQNNLQSAKEKLEEVEDHAYGSTYREEANSSRSPLPLSILKKSNAFNNDEANTSAENNNLASMPQEILEFQEVSSYCLVVNECDRDIAVRHEGTAETDIFNISDGLASSNPGLEKSFERKENSVLMYKSDALFVQELDSTKGMNTNEQIESNVSPVNNGNNRKVAVSEKLQGVVGKKITAEAKEASLTARSSSNSLSYSEEISADMIGTEKTKEAPLTARQPSTNLRESEEIYADTTRSAEAKEALSIARHSSINLRESEKVPGIDNSDMVAFITPDCAIDIMHGAEDFFLNSDSTPEVMEDKTVLVGQLDCSDHEDRSRYSDTTLHSCEGATLENCVNTEENFRSHDDNEQDKNQITIVSEGISIKFKETFVASTESKSEEVCVVSCSPIFLENLIQIEKEGSFVENETAQPDPAVHQFGEEQREITCFSTSKATALLMVEKVEVKTPLSHIRTKNELEEQPDFVAISDGPNAQPSNVIESHDPSEEIQIDRSYSKHVEGVECQDENTTEFLLTDSATRCNLETTLDTKLSDTEAEANFSKDVLVKAAGTENIFDLHSNEPEPTVGGIQINDYSVLSQASSATGEIAKANLEGRSELERAIEVTPEKSCQNNGAFTGEGATEIFRTKMAIDTGPNKVVESRKVVSRNRDTFSLPTKHVMNLGVVSNCNSSTSEQSKYVSNEALSHEENFVGVAKSDVESKMSNSDIKINMEVSQQVAVLSGVYGDHPPLVYEDCAAGSMDPTEPTQVSAQDWIEDISSRLLDFKISSVKKACKLGSSNGVRSKPVKINCYSTNGKENTPAVSKDYSNKDSEEKSEISNSTRKPLLSLNNNRCLAQ